MRLSKKTALHGDRERHQPPELQMLQVAQADLGTHCVTQVELLIFLPHLLSVGIAEPCLVLSPFLTVPWTLVWTQRSFYKQ